MDNVGNRQKTVLITGSGRLVYSVTICLLQAGHTVTLYTDNGREALQQINVYCADLKKPPFKKLRQSSLSITEQLPAGEIYSLAIAVVPEDTTEKKALIAQLETILPTDAILAINTESIPLDLLQEGTLNPARIIGLNWSEPAQTTWFLEIIANQQTDKELISLLFTLAKESWKKDPYVIPTGTGVRSKFLSALVREAFYLVENGYATIEDIDRACRNDPGYYLSFAGNFRYMDLMGSGSYGVVMKDLNPELSKALHVPEFFTRLVRLGMLGMEVNKGLYNYSPEDVSNWEETFRKYSHQIREIIEKYPFGYLDENA